MRVVVSGGAGFIGSHLVDALCNLGCDVIVIDDLSNGNKENINSKVLEFHRVSILDKDAIDRICENAKTIIHLAALGSVPRSLVDPVRTFRVNAEGTLNLLESSKENRAHFVFSSSSSVFGKNILNPKRSNSQAIPISPYGASKLSGEGLVSAYGNSYSIPTSIFRFFNVYGPRQMPEHPYAAVIPKFLLLAMEGRPLPIFGDGLQTRDFTYVGDVVNVLVECVVQERLFDGPINLGFGIKTTLVELTKLIGETLSLPLQLEFLKPRIGDIYESWADPDYLLSVFKNVKPTSLANGLEITSHWIKKEILRQT